jgi:hypothetical protein
MELSVSLILQAIYFVVFAYYGVKLLIWLYDYFYRMSVINRIKGMTMIPFVGNAHQLQPRESNY